MGLPQELPLEIYKFVFNVPRIRIGFDRRRNSLRPKDKDEKELEHRQNPYPRLLKAIMLACRQTQGEVLGVLSKLHIELYLGPIYSIDTE